MFYLKILCYLYFNDDSVYVCVCVYVGEMSCHCFQFALSSPFPEMFQIIPSIVLKLLHN